MDLGGTQRGNSGQRDAFTAAHWNGSVDVVVHHAPLRAEAGVDQRVHVLFGRRLDSAMWARLVGAPDGATVHVLPSPAPDYRHGVQLRVDHPWLDGAAIRYVFEDLDGDVAMVNDWLRVRGDAPAGVGTRMLAIQAHMARSLGVLYIAAEAVGAPGSTSNGYYTWARLGFDGPLPAQLRAVLPAEWRTAQRVLDIIESPAGPQWWRAHGRRFEGIFDLRAESRSWRVLQGYTSEKGIVV